MTQLDQDTVADYRALRTGTALVDYTGAGIIRIAGPAAPAFVGQVTTRNVDFLLEGQISTALLLDDDGSVVAEVLVQCHGAEYVVDVWPDQAEAALEHLTQAAAGNSEVTVTDESGQTRLIGIEGPESFKLAQRFTDFPVPSIAYRSFVGVDWSDVPMMLSRVGVSGEYGYKFQVPAEHGDALRTELLRLGARAVGREALDICRMELRFVNLEHEGAGASTPFDLGLQWMVDFGHEFTGREKLLVRWREAVGSRPVCWSAGEGLADVPAGGTPLQVAGSTVGEITHAVWSPSMQRVIGTAMLADSVAVSGVEVALAGSGALVRTISAPFIRSTSLDTTLE
jgi:aminomethyltransferase